ncbi:hypothetical protein ABFX02_13G065100 [Erythranthe guttata]
MTGGGAARMPSWKERENNKRRERRRRAIAAKIFAGLRLYGNYKLPKHCDNNEVLKALCDEAGWTVEHDGTTYRKGCRPVENMDTMETSYNPSTHTSYNPSPHTSYNPSPASSSFPSPVSSIYAPSIIADGNSLIPWLRNLSSSSSSATSSSKFIHHHYMHNSGTVSAPVTPPLSSSPTARDLLINADRVNSFARPFLPLSTPPSPARHPPLPARPYPYPIQSGPTSPTFSLVSSNPFGFRVEDLSRSGSLMCTPGQSGTCSPVIGASDIPMAEVIPNEFAFGSNAKGLVKAWEGERIHEVCGSDELELTLGISKTR